MTAYALECEGNGEGVQRALVCLRVAGQWFGVPSERAHGAVRDPHIMRVPKSRADVCGVVHANGRIVTVIDMRRRLGLAKTEKKKGQMLLVVEHEGHYYGLLGDAVEDVIQVPVAEISQDGEEYWSDLASGVCRIGEERMAVVDIEKLLVF